MSHFTEFNIPKFLIDNLNKMQISTPTPIQSQAIPVALSGEDLLASAQTGSGKTIAYAVPLLTKLSLNPTLTALILAPTRELATQVHASLALLAPNVKTALLIGGASMFNQMKALRKQPRVIVGTPGRINDHLDRKTLSLKETRFLIVDEADRMLDMGFGVQLDRIEEFLPKPRQTLMFSATFPPNIDRLSKKYLSNPQRIMIESTVQSAPKISQEILHVPHAKKFSLLLEQLNQRQGSVIIFAKTKRGADHLSDDLVREGHSATAIHGNLSQNKRDRVIRSFRESKHRILVATDIAARGLDIPHVMHVINYDLPQCPEDYVHRIGRTGRAGAEGFALCLISPKDNEKWGEIERLLDPSKKREPARKQEPRYQHKRRSRPWQKRFR